MARKAKGERPAFFHDPQVDKLLAVTMALAGEVSVLRERLDSIERLAEAKGLLSQQEIESYRPDAQAAEERERWRGEYIARVLRVVREELEAVEKGETPEPHSTVVRAVSS